MAASEPNLEKSFIAGASDQETILVVDDEPLIRNLLSEILAREKYSILVAGSGSEGLELFRRHRPYIVVTDLYMPDLDGLGLLRAIRREQPETKVIMVTGFGDEETAFSALRAGASNFIMKPIHRDEFLFIIRSHERMLQAQRRQTLPSGLLMEGSKLLRLSNDVNLIYPAVHNLTHDLRGFLEPSELETLALALSEALFNAIEHGNLGIGYQDKSDALQKNRYQQLLDSRMAEPGRKDREVLLNFVMNRETVFFKITDQGDGFDWHNAPDPRNPDNIYKEHGRGLSIISLFMDEVGFNELGNEIWMRKKLNPISEPAA